MLLDLHMHEKKKSPNLEKRHWKGVDGNNPWRSHRVGNSLYSNWPEWKPQLIHRALGRDLRGYYTNKAAKLAPD